MIYPQIVEILHPLPRRVVVVLRARPPHPVVRKRINQIRLLRINLRKQRDHSIEIRMMEKMLFKLIFIRMLVEHRHQQGPENKTVFY